MTSENAAVVNDDQDVLERIETVSCRAELGEALAGSPGEQLKFARETLGWSIDQVAEKLHMTVAKVRYLENDEYERLRSPTFVQGYIRSYASLLKLDPKHLVSDYDAYLKQLESTTDHLAGEPDGDIPKAASAQSRFLVFAIVACVIVAVVAFVLFSGNDEPAPVVAKPVEQAAEVSAEAIAVPPTAAETLGIKVVSEQPAFTNVEETSSDLGDTSVDAGVADTTLNATTAQLKLVFSDDCWVEITDVSGEKIFAELKKLGEQMQLTGAPPFDVVLGNARAAQVWIDGQSVALNPQPNRKLLRLTLNKPAISDLPSGNSF